MFVTRRKGRKEKHSERRLEEPCGGWSGDSVLVMFGWVKVVSFFWTFMPRFGRSNSSNNRRFTGICKYRNALPTLGQTNRGRTAALFRRAVAEAASAPGVSLAARPTRTCGTAGTMVVRAAATNRTSSTTIALASSRVRAKRRLRSCRSHNAHQSTTEGDSFYASNRF